MEKISVFSEIGRLKSVLLHRPTEELNNLTPTQLSDLLFDDIPWLPLAQKEHDQFAKVFRDNGVEVLYLTDLLEEAIGVSLKVKIDFINDFISDANIESETLSKVIFKYLCSIKTNKELINKMISGIKKEELEGYKKRTLTDYVEKNKFATNPIPNLYFMRDPFSSIGNGVSINSMYYDTRKRETLFLKYIFNYHLKLKDTPKYYDRSNTPSLEGGDIHVLNKNTLLIGVSQRTNSHGIELLAKNLFYKNKTSFDKIVVLSIPKQRTFMHLDTVFTQVDKYKFTIHKGSNDLMDIYFITKNSSNNKKIKVTKFNGTLKDALESLLNHEVTLIPCGGNDDIASDREQWSDGSNCVCIAPGTVIAYERNEITNKLLEEYGIKVIRIPSSELSRGRGGPRCMSMPLERYEVGD